MLRILRWNPHGAVLMTRGFGTREGGAFEQVPGLAVFIIRDALIERFESFDAADAERALARFEELCAGREEPGR